MKPFAILLFAGLALAVPCSAGINASAEFSIAQDWGAGANATLRIYNHGTTEIPAWPLEFNFARNITPYNNVHIENHDGEHFVLQPETFYDDPIPAGGSIFFDMQVNPGNVGGEEPLNIMVGGQPIGGPVLVISEPSVIEGDSGVRSLLFTITLSEAPQAGELVSADFATSPGTATSGVDFIATTGTLIFSAGEISKAVSVAVRGDTVEEDNETLLLSLSGVSGAAVANATASGTIIDDDLIIKAGVGDATVFESDDSTREVAVVITLDQPALSVMSVHAETRAGSAAAGTDFVPVSRMITFNVGELSRTFGVAILGDTEVEATESFTVALFNPAGDLAITGDPATITIYDNDGGAFGGVLINEVCAAPGSRALRWDDEGIVRLGMGMPWTDPAFNDDSWSRGTLPAGHGVAGLATDLGTVMTGLTPSLYLRKEFIITPGQAASSSELILRVDYDDGFIAYLNGVEVARANMGPPGHFCYSHQPAYNARPSDSLENFSLGAASAHLVAGTNVLAIQAHNAVTDPADRGFDLSPSFRVNSALVFASPSAVLVGPGEAWNYFVGLAEPSGGIIDPVLLGGGFTAPASATRDFEDRDEFSDWVELRNTSSDPVDISGWTLSDNPSKPSKWHFPTGTTIPGSGYLLVLCDDREEANGFTRPERAAVIAAGSSWKYYDRDFAPPAGWKSITFPDNSWASGPAPLGYSPDNEDGAATIIAGGKNTHFTDYFRRAFTVEDPAAISGDLTIRYQRDDGLVIWLNGIELARDNMPPGNPGHTTPAADNASGEGKWYSVTVPATALVAGDNVLAVETHQGSANSTDVRFDLELATWQQVPGAPAAMLHASFSLGADGEPLSLHDADGSVVDAIAAWPAQDTFRSWGRSSSNPALLGYQEATPRAANGESAPPARTAAPEFLAADGNTPLPSGFYQGSQTLVLKCATPGASIRYTTDGSQPLESGHGNTYTAPLTLERVNEKTAAIIRARAFAPGHIPSKDLSFTYLISQNPRIETLPAISLVEDAGHSFFLPEGIMAISGGSFDGKGKWQPGDIDSYNVPQHRGPATERKTSVELVYPDGAAGFRDKVAIRMAGSGYTRPRYRMEHTGDSPWRLYTPPEKGSMNLIWRDEIGADELDFELFPGWHTTNFKQLRLRAGNNDSINPFICDEYVRRLFGEMGHDSLRGMFAMLYVNGSFKGIYNLCERLRNETFQNHFISKEDWDVKYNNDYSAGDSTEHAIFRNIYEKDMSVPANYAAMQQAADLVNFADYYLLNIYANMWDWATWGSGANNYVLYRERVPTGTWRFTVWDAEGGFLNQGYFNQASFDLISENLTGSDDTNELARIWKHLVGVPPFNNGDTRGSAEFRLLVADRIHKHFFNGGILDDRSSDNRVHTLKDELRDTVREGIEYMAGSWNENWFDAWVDARNGRRSHLLGPADSQFPDAGVWPATPPPVFSRHGGNVTPGEGITMSAIPAGASVYYTVDGSDPRLSGSAISPLAEIHTGIITINVPLVINARVRSASGEWSALATARFSVPLTAPSVLNLVVSEIMYNPPPVSAVEQAAGYSDANDFEFIRLTNIGPDMLGIEGLHLSDGVSFDFSDSDVVALQPGASVLIVGNRSAFNLRYGNAHAASIAGEFLGKLKNGGEKIQLDLAGGVVMPLHTISYDDIAPWPRAADGFGSSLLLADPSGAPDHGLAASWTGSAHPGGHPGGVPLPLTYDAWKTLAFNAPQAAEGTVSGPLADPDRDGNSNFAEYALGGSPLLADAGLLRPRVSVMRDGGAIYLALEHLSVPTAIEATVNVENSIDLVNWSSEGLVETEDPVSSTSGHSIHSLRREDPIAVSVPAAFVRLRVQ
ncbi:MAG: Calx-beta domain-containing protein [Roseibacillus sp.]